MRKRPRTLSAAFVGRVSRPGFYGDGRGGRGLNPLAKRVTGTDRLSGCQRIRLGGAPDYLDCGVGVDALAGGNDQLVGSAEGGTFRMGRTSTSSRAAPTGARSPA